MIRPPLGLWRFIRPKAPCAQRKAPLRLTSTTAFHCAKVSSSSGHGGRAKPGVVEQEVEPAEARLDRREQALDRLRIADVAAMGDGAAAERADLARDLVELVAPPAGERHMPAGARQRHRRRLADARRRRR